MNFISSLLGIGKVTVKSVVADAQKQLLTLYGAAKPTDAQKLKAFVYLCIAATAMLNDFGRGRAKTLIDQVAKETAGLTKPLRMLVGELANDPEELEKILATFPTELKITESTSINGLGAFDALYHAKADELVNDIWSHRDGPNGTPGYAAIVVAVGIFGREGHDRLAQHFFLANLQLQSFATKLLKLA
jgi:hypothetical protein